MQRAGIILFLKLCMVFMTLIAAGSFELLKDGGATSEVFQESVREYSGVLSLVVPVWLLLGYLTCVVGVIGRWHRFKISKHELLWVVYILVSVLSLAWVLDLYFALRSLLICFLCIFLAFVSSRYLSADELIKFIARLTLFVLVLSVLVAVFIPSYGVSIGEHEGKWQGIFRHKNALGNFAAMSFCIFLSILYRRIDFLALSGVLLSLIVTIKTQSFTAVAVILSGVIFFSFFLFRLRWRSSYVLGGLAGVLLCIICISLVWLSIEGLAVDVFGKDTTFSNRNIIWRHYFQQAAETPLWGRGFDQLVIYAKEYYSEYRQAMGFIVGAAHNGFIELYFNQGVIGFFVFLCLILNFIGMSYSPVRWLFVLGGLFLVSFIVTNTFESRLIGLNVHFVYFVLLYWFFVSGRFEFSKKYDAAVLGVR